MFLAQASAAIQGVEQGIGKLTRTVITFHVFYHLQYYGIFFLQLLGEVEATNEFNIRLKAERMAREREAAKELEKKVIAADGEFDTELTNRFGNEARNMVQNRAPRKC